MNIINMFGEYIVNRSMEVSAGKNNVVLDVNNLAAGIYALKINWNGSINKTPVKFLKL